MRPFAQPRLSFAIAAVAALLAGRALAQSAAAPNGASDNRLEAAAVDALLSKAQETPEEAEQITVEGQRRGNVLGKYRLEMTKARDNIVDVFNRVNTDDDTDVRCRNEKPTGTRMGHSVCRSKAEETADAAAAKGFLDALWRGTNIGAPKTGVGSEPGIEPSATPGTTGSAGSQGKGVGGEASARAALEEEMKKMMAENRELFRAVVKYVEVRDDYYEYRDKNDTQAVD